MDTTQDDAIKEVVKSVAEDIVACTHFVSISCTTADFNPVATVGPPTIDDRVLHRSRSAQKVLEEMRLHFNEMLKSITRPIFELFGGSPYTNPNPAVFKTVPSVYQALQSFMRKLREAHEKIISVNLIDQPKKRRMYINQIRESLKSCDFMLTALLEEQAQYYLPRERFDSDSDALFDLCVHCSVNEINTGLIHGDTTHAVCCLSCAEQLRDCPKCQEQIERIEVYV